MTIISRTARRHSELGRPVSVRLVSNDAAEIFLRYYLTDLPTITAVTHDTAGDVVLHAVTSRGVYSRLTRPDPTPLNSRSTCPTCHSERHATSLDDDITSLTTSFTRTTTTDVKEHSLLIVSVYSTEAVSYTHLTLPTILRV